MLKNKKIKLSLLSGALAVGLLSASAVIVSCGSTTDAKAPVIKIETKSTKG